jgi:hypothetical protein
MADNKLNIDATDEKIICGLRRDGRITMKRLGEPGVDQEGAVRVGDFEGGVADLLNVHMKHLLSLCKPTL